MFKSLASFFVIVVLLVGCKSKTEECVAPAIDKNLVGTWKAVVIEDGKTADTGELTFGADGSLKDTKNLLLGTAVPKTTSIPVFNRS